jgi:hypothetical protein
MPKTALKQNSKKNQSSDELSSLSCPLPNSVQILHLSLFLSPQSSQNIEPHSRHLINAFEAFLHMSHFMFFPFSLFLKKNKKNNNLKALIFD